jgi:putative endonuclease
MSRLKGNIAENKAVEFLKQKGLSIIEQNYYAKKMGEIDIIATKGDVYHFVEVKSGTSYDAVYNITPAKLHKLIKSIYYYLKVKNLDVKFCIDAIIVHDNKIDMIENITL